MKKIIIGIFILMNYANSINVKNQTKTYKEENATEHLIKMIEINNPNFSYSVEGKEVSREKFLEFTLLKELKTKSECPKKYRELLKQMKN